jgi:hypothetical protein
MTILRTIRPSQCMAGTFPPCPVAARTLLGWLVSRRRRCPVCCSAWVLGAFIDGIVLHQILQWHHMVSDISRYPVNTIAGLEVNTSADGFLDLATWGSCPGRFHRRDQGLAAGTPGTDLEVPFRARPDRLGRLQRRGGADRPSYLASITCGTILVGRSLGTSGF